MIEYSLTRMRRKTLAIYIRGGCVEVRAPLRMTKREIDSFVLSKEDWILKNLKRVRLQTRQQCSFVVDYECEILLRGKAYPVISRDSYKSGFDGTSFYISPGLTPEQVKMTCVQIYKQLALTHFNDRVKYYSEIMGIAPSAVQVTNAKKRWGSCSSKKKICFTWRLVLADDDLIDYVIVHELAHLIEMNHSSRFWAVVEKILPDYANRRAGLRILHKRLAQESWD